MFAFFEKIWYDILEILKILFMKALYSFFFSKKMLTFVLFSCLFCIYFSLDVFADTSLTSDMTGTGFMIDLNTMDPIRNTTNGSTPPKWFEAFKTILEYISNFLLGLIPLIAGVSFIIAGYFFIFSGGEGDKVSKAKGIIKFNIIAIIVAFMSWSIIYLISTFLWSLTK